MSSDLPRGRGMPGLNAAATPLGAAGIPLGAAATRYPVLTIPSGPAVVALVAGIVAVVVLLIAASALPLFVVGLALAYLIDPAVTALTRRGVSRPIASVALIVLLILIGLVFIVVVAASTISQGSALVATAPAALGDARAWIATLPVDPTLRDVLDRFVDGLATTLGTVNPVDVLPAMVESVSGAVGASFAAIGLPFYVFLVVVDRPGLGAEMERRLPEPWRADILVVVGIIVRQFGNYVRSEFVLMVLLGTVTWLGLLLLAAFVDPRIASYALFLAVIAAFSELIPLIGPWIATIPALIFGLTLGPMPLLAIAVLYVVISFVEGNVMVPAIEGRSFALRPAVVAPALAIGFALGGAFGAILAIPTVSAARDIYLYLFRRSTGLPPAEAMPRDLQPLGEVPIRA